MTPFLRQVADIYASREADRIHSYCFVFPNKRSAAFFRHHLEEALSAAVLMPEITTITDFVAEFSPLTEANRYEQLFTLYDEYRKQPGVDVDFNKFVFWGDMLMNDFNDVDRYLVDPKSIFINVKRLKEISANYLTEKQISVIKRYWGVQLPFNDPDHLWNHIEYADRPAAQSKFARLWQVLLPLYEGYTARLRDKGLATQGMLYRNAAESLSADRDTDLPYERCIFVGFNVLTTAEHKIFSRLQRRGKADFYWDFDSPMARIPHNRPGKFISQNMRDYPSRYPLEEFRCDNIPHTEILAVSSNIGQTKVAGCQLRKWLETGQITDRDNATDTAIVLPDESLFIPMIHSVPEDISNINVTMGFPMRYAPVAALMSSIISLQLRSRKRSATGEVTYFFEDVESLITNPGISYKSPDGVRRIANRILTDRIYNVPAALILELAPELAPVFAPIDNPDSLKSVIGYIRELCRFLNDGIDDSDRMQRVFVEAYSQAVTRLEEAADEFGVNMNGNSFFKMIERAVNSESINFFGEPLRGLQIMGVLETRALDFNNVIMLSMNERVFPRKHYTRSFIPDPLRKDYGMATTDFQESIFAYYFYRLISRARNVTLIYDSRRVGGCRNSGISRYPAQLLYIFGNRDVTHRNMLYPQCYFRDGAVSARKTERVMKLLEQFATPEGKNLSASAINTYINCPLSFYLQYVEGFNPPDEVTDYMTDSTYGTIFHEMAQTLYESLRPVPDEPFTVTSGMLEEFLRPNNLFVDKLVVEMINKHYHRLPEERRQERLVGESMIVGKVLRASLLEVIRRDIELTPFTYVGSEVEIRTRLAVSPRLTVNFRLFIDRVDEAQGSLRFIDYKTGDESLTSPSVEDLFETDTDRRAKGLMQLLTYCEVYREATGNDRPIRPMIYKLRTIAPKGVPPVRINKKNIDDYHEVSDSFRPALIKTIESIFDPDVPFRQCSDDHACKFCKFTGICHREKTDSI